MEEGLRKKSEFGAHKAFFLSWLTEKADIFLVSSLSKKSLKRLFVKPMAFMEEALKKAFKKLGPNPLTYILPQGELVFSWVEEKSS